MAVSIEEMIKAIKTDNVLREETFQKAVVKNWYADDATGRGQYASDLELAPASATGATAPVGYDALTVKQKQVLLADLQISDYEKKVNKAERKSAGNLLIASGIGELVLTAGLWASALALPSVSIDDYAIKSEMQSQAAEVQAYMKRHDGRSPPWEISEEEIKRRNTSNHQPFKTGLGYTGLLALIAGLGSIVGGYFKRK